MISESSIDLHHAFYKFESLFLNGKLALGDHRHYTESIQLLAQYPDQAAVQAQMDDWRKRFPALGSNATMQGAACNRPIGSAFEFELIQRIYQEWHSDHPEMRTWDHFFHQQLFPLAIRNRKEYYKDLLQELAANNAGERIEVLHLGSSSCQDILEFLKTTKDLRFHFTVVEPYSEAIAAATKKMGEDLTHVRFVHQNFARYIPYGNFELVWAADALASMDDGRFIHTLRKLKQYPHLVIGNFAEESSAKHFMTTICNWHPTFRQPKALKLLAKAAGFDTAHVFVESEPCEAIHFLHIHQQPLNNNHQIQ